MALIFSVITHKAATTVNTLIGKRVSDTDPM